MAALGGLIAGRLGDVWPAFDIAAHFTTHFTAMAILAALAVVWPRLALLALPLGAVTIVTSVALHATLATAIPDAAELPSQGRSGTRLTVVALNTWHANRTPEQIALYLNEVRADVVLLSEFGPTKQRLLDDLKALYPYRVSCAHRWFCSLVLLSRHPLSDFGMWDASSERPPVVWARVQLGTGPGVTVVGTHVYRPSRSPRLHLRHLDALSRWLDTIDGPVVVGGDFNSTDWASAYRRFTAETRLTEIGPGRPSWPAWPVTLPQFALDHILARSGISQIAAGVGQPVGSDHLPIWTVLEFDRGS